jgi:hypothetical protein
MTASVVFRVNKLKSWGHVAATAQHNLRTRATPNASGKVEVIKGPPDGDVVEQVQRTIGAQNIRKNAVFAVEVILSASPEYFRPTCPEKFGTWDQQRLDAWREKVLPWIRSKFEHAASVVLHLDEATPHFQIIDVPLSATGKLNSRGKFGGRQKLREWQDEAAKAVESLGIQRGIRGSLAEHERIKAYYEATNAPVPELPSLKTRMPAPLAQPSADDQVPLSEGKARRDQLETDHAREIAEHVRELTEMNLSLTAMCLQLALKARIADQAQRQKKNAEATARKLAAELARIKLQADRIRLLKLSEVLVRIYDATEAVGSKPKHPSRKFDLPDGRLIQISGERWIDSAARNLGEDAIDLVKHLDGIESGPAIRLLAEAFDAPIVVAEYARSRLGVTEQNASEFIKDLPVPAPVESSAKWHLVGDWLERSCGIPKKLVAKLHDKKLVYADKSGNVVFRRERGGAMIAGTSVPAFGRIMGGVSCGPFIVPASNTRAATFLTGTPMDALALAAIRPDVEIVVCGGKSMPLADVKEFLPTGIPVYAAFPASAAGERLAVEAAKVFGALRYAPSRSAKNWAQNVKDEPELISKIWADDDQNGDTADDAEPGHPRWRG